MNNMYIVSIQTLKITKTVVYKFEKQIAEP
jgi:hypothetical protein